MNTEEVEISKRAVSCKKWKWLPGMRAVGRKGAPEAWFRVEENLPKLHGDWSEALPDLSDPATIGCLLSLVREVCGDKEMAYSRCESGWVLLLGSSRVGVASMIFPSKTSVTEAGLLVNALEEAAKLDGTT
jgi:hypothetical protein